MSESNSSAARFCNRKPTSWFHRFKCIPDKTQISGPLPLRYNFSGQFHEKNLQVRITYLKSIAKFSPTIFFFSSFINGLEMVHIVGTYEKAELEEGEVYEVVNIKTLKQATPNLRIINLYGVSFVDDTHVEAFSSNCIQLQVRKLSKWVCRICLFFQKRKKTFAFSFNLFNFVDKRNKKAVNKVRGAHVFCPWQIKSVTKQWPVLHSNIFVCSNCIDCGM